YDVFSSNDDLLKRMRAGPTSYDIIVPTNQFVPTYLKLDLIEPLRQDLIPNLTNLDMEFVETDYDPGNRVNERVLNIYNWSDYIDDRTIPLFQAQANLRVNYDVFSSNEDLLARMKAGPTSYDIIVPTNNFIPTYLKADLIEPLRQDLIPNLTNLDREFVETDYDPGNRYTVPWQWGTTGVGFNRSKVPGGKLDSWAAVFEPGAVAKGRVTLLREVTDLIGCALIYLGKSPNSIEDADLAEVVKLVRSARPKLKGFTTDTYIDELAADETWVAQGWSGDVFQAQDQNQDVSYAIPKEGSLRFVDVMAIPKGAPHPGTASRFMNYVLHPKVQARISKYVSYGTPVSLAKPLLPPNQTADPSIYPPASTKLS
ncbi:MAG: polyamine ABC transporter substrate-binding protein, partial [Actinomycetota bacterium]